MTAGRTHKQYWAGPPLLAEIAGGGERRRPRIVCLLPVRNGEHDLRDYLDSVARICDAIVALDDGSTDGTREILRSSPLVTTLLTNPPRSSFSGWNDGENRRRLLEAAAEADPDWILSLDVDERISPDDAVALRRFVETDAIPGMAYGFKHVRMWGTQCDPRFTWIYRLFAFEPGLTFPAKRMHFPPIPKQIPEERWIRTTLRVQHVGAINTERLQLRFQKYQEADPDGEFAVDICGLGAPPHRVVPWKTRRSNEAVLPRKSLRARRRPTRTA